MLLLFGVRDQLSLLGKTAQVAPENGQRIRSPNVQNCDSYSNITSLQICYKSIRLVLCYVKKQFLFSGIVCNNLNQCLNGTVINKLKVLHISTHLNPALPSPQFSQREGSIPHTCTFTRLENTCAHIPGNQRSPKTFFSHRRSNYKERSNSKNSPHFAFPTICTT